jgi:hypothetical protein
MKIFKWKYGPWGNCPVQAEGWFLGYHFYFRSRWETARIEFSKSEEDWEENKIERTYYLASFPSASAGWISERKATLLIIKGLFLFLLRWESDND